jgi:hypothetical protein
VERREDWSFERAVARCFVPAFVASFVVPFLVSLVAMREWISQESKF